MTCVTLWDTLVSDMVTYAHNDLLSLTLFGKARRGILALLYGHSEEAFYLRQLVRTSGVGLGPAQRELKKLTAAGIITRTRRGNQVYFQANRSCPVFRELKDLISKTVGVTAALEAALAPLAGRIKLAFIFGSLSRGGEKRDSDVDVLVVGKLSFAELSACLGPVQEGLGREVNPHLYPPAEFRRKIRSGHHFLNSVVKGEKTFLIGDENELTGLAKERLAG